MPHADNSSSRGPNNEEWLRQRKKEIGDLQRSREWQKSIPLIKEAITKVEMWSGLSGLEPLYSALAAALDGVGRKVEGKAMQEKADAILRAEAEAKRLAQRDSD